MGRTQSWETGGWGCPRALPFSPAPPRSSDLGVQAAERGDRRGAAGQAEAAPRPALLHPGLEKRKGPCVRVSAADPLGTEMGSGTPRSEEAEEKEPVVWGLGGWGGPGLGRHTNNHAKRGGRPWQLQGGRAAVYSPRQRIGALLFLPSVLRPGICPSLCLENSHPLPFSGCHQLPVSCPPIHTTSHPCEALETPGMYTRQPLPAQPGNLPALGSQGQGRRGWCWGSRPQPPSSSSGAASFGLSPNYPLTLFVLVSPLLWSLFLSHSPFLFDCLSPVSPSVSLSNLCAFQSLSLSHTLTHTRITFSPNPSVSVHIFFS